jgi:hypothetical protein
MGNYWEAADASSHFPFVPLESITSSPRSNEPTRWGRSDVITILGGQPVFPVSGSSGYIDPDDSRPPNDHRPDNSRGREHHLDYYTEERYWTDYVRIGLPILGIIIVGIVALLWIIPFFTDDDDGGDLGAGGTATTALPVIGASPTQTTQPGAATGTPRIILTTPAGATTPAVGNPQSTVPTEVVEPSGEIYAGATVRVANTGGTGVNMRASPSVDGEVVTVLPDGAELVTTGEAEEADGFLWWPVESEAGSGYVVEDYLVLVE